MASTEGIVDKATDYVDLIHQFDKKVKENLEDKNRFVQFKDRQSRGSLLTEQMKDISRGKYLTYWKGMSLMKDPMTLIIYQQYLWHEKPSTIFETGSYTGASAMWFADTMRLYNYPFHMYSVELNMKLIDPRAMKDKDITFIEGDVTKIEEAFPPEMLEKLPHPWVLTEDAHVGLTKVMEHFHQFMIPGDYFIIEDTNPGGAAAAGQGLIEDYHCWGSSKLNTLKQFMEKYDKYYRVDTFYCDFYGYNAHWNWNGFIKRIL